MSGWNPNELETLRVNWIKLSAAQMMEFIPGKTRNAILGKANRMGLPSKKLSKDSQPPKPKTRKVVIQFKKPLPPIPVAKVMGPEGPFVPFLQAKYNTCRAIMVDHGDNGLAMFCSNKTTDGVSFCPYHMDRYYQKKIA